MLEIQASTELSRSYLPTNRCPDRFPGVLDALPSLEDTVVNGWNGS